MWRRFIIFTLTVIGLVMESNGVVMPKALKPGDKIAIVAPSGKVNREFVDSAAMVLGEIGYEPVVYPTAYGEAGSFSGTPSQRLADLRDALTNPEISAVICARGGYGSVHLLDSLSQIDFTKQPKWVVGFSDISAIHALLSSKGVASIHASMAKQIAKGPENEQNRLLFDMLQGKFPVYDFEPHPYNHGGVVTGKLIGGNLSVLQALIDTPYDVFEPGTILFIEDIAEPIYKIERILYQLKLAGIMEKLGGLIIGQFTGYDPDANYDSMYDMISGFLQQYPSLPVAFNIPVGHADANIPLLESQRHRLTVLPSVVTLTPLLSKYKP